MANAGMESRLQALVSLLLSVLKSIYPEMESPLSHFFLINNQTSFPKRIPHCLVSGTFVPEYGMCFCPMARTVTQSC